MLSDILEYFWIFAIYSFFGWCLEVVYCSVNTGKFVNRGFLNGAICPIYGLGAVITILSLTPVQDKLFLLYFGTVILGSAVELVGGFVLKKLFHISWWDYQNQPLNIGGYICLKFSLGWGVAGVILMRVIHPLICSVIVHIPTVQLFAMQMVFYIFLIMDLAITVLAVLELGRDVREITHLSGFLNKGSDRMAESIGNTALQTAAKIKELELSGKTKKIKTHIQTVSEDSRVKIHEKLENSERLNVLLNKRSIVRRRLFKAFPRLRDLRDNNAVQEMKQRIKNRDR